MKPESNEIIKNLNILLCPFCGSVAELRQFGEPESDCECCTEYYPFYISCTGIHCSAVIPFYRERDAVIADWNKRFTLNNTSMTNEEHRPSKKPGITCYALRIYTYENDNCETSETVAVSFDTNILQSYYKSFNMTHLYENSYLVDISKHQDCVYRSEPHWMIVPILFLDNAQENSCQ